MISYIGSFLILLALLNASLLVLSKPVLSKITSVYDALILSTSKLQFPLVLIAFICLIISFVDDDFSLKYISSNSNSALPFFFKKKRRVYTFESEPLKQAQLGPY